MDCLNSIITGLLANFTVDGTTIPAKWQYYQGHGEPYLTWQQVDMDNSYAGDDSLLGYVTYIDFDVYSKGNYMRIIEELYALLTNNHFTFQPSRTSADMYEVDTGYYHKTLCFGYLKQEENNG